MEKVFIQDIAINNLSFEQVIDRVDYLIKNDVGKYIVTPNIDHVVKLRYDLEFQAVYKEASLVVADGMPLVWAAGFLGMPLQEKISGSDLLPKLCAVAEKKGYKLFFLGGRDGAAKKAAEIFRYKFPSIQVVGTYCPYWGFEKDTKENEKIVEMIKETKPDILFVGLGAPKQEKWIYKYKEQYQVPVSIGIGASFDFVSGMVRRAPVWMQKIGLEWFWRLLMEPQRLWRRYLIDDMKFFELIFRQKFFKKKDKS